MKIETKNALSGAESITVTRRLEHAAGIIKFNGPKTIIVQKQNET
jgi:hypothetical protein